MNNTKDRDINIIKDIQLILDENKKLLKEKEELENAFKKCQARSNKLTNENVALKKAVSDFRNEIDKLEIKEF